MKMIVSDLDGTFLDSSHKVIEENVQAFKKAQEQGVEIVIASGRNYGNVLTLFENTGLKPHIISNNGAFVYDKEGTLVKGMGLDKRHVQDAVEWLEERNYFYTLCTDHSVYMPVNTEEILMSDFENATNLVKAMTPETLREGIDLFLNFGSGVFVDDFREIIAKDLTFGNISAITIDQDKLSEGREYFAKYDGMSMTIAGNNIFEMIHPSVSKGNALEYLTSHVGVSLEDVMAVGDNYNDISMLEKVGASVAVGNAEEEVKKICKYQSLSNDERGVAHIVHKMLAKQLAQ